MRKRPASPFTAFASSRSEGQVFWEVTAMPSAASRWAPRTLGSSPTWTMQPGSWKEAESRPRGRWYFMLRENTRSPAAASAETMVSPA